MTSKKRCAAMAKAGKVRIDEKKPIIKNRNYKIVGGLEARALTNRRKSF